MRMEIKKLFEQLIKKINETKSWFCEKINNSDKDLATLIKENKREEPNK